MIITHITGIWFALWLGLSYLGLDRFFGLYKKIPHFDKIIHGFAGVVISMFMIDNGYTLFTIVWLNLLLAFLWEWWQIAVKKRVGFKVVGFPEGYGDIVVHMIATLGYLIYIGLL